MTEGRGRTPRVPERGQTPRLRRNKFQRAVAARGLTSVLAFALLLLAAPASASPPATGLKAVPAAASAIEPAQFQRRPMSSKKAKKLPPRLKPGRLSVDDPPPHKTPDRRPDRTPDRPRDTPRDTPRDGPTHDDPRQPKQTRDPRFPHFPPVVILPDVPAEQATVLQSLPRRMDERTRDRPVPERVTREILVLVDQTRPQSLGANLAQAYGLDLVSSRPIALIGARAELFRVRAGRSEAA